MQSQQISDIMRSKIRALLQIAEGVLPGGGEIPGGAACAQLSFVAVLINIIAKRAKTLFTQ